MKKKYFSMFLVGVFVILIQSFLQHGSELKEIISIMYGALKPFIYAIFISILLYPLMTFLEEKLKIKRGLAIFLSLTISFLVIIGLILVVIPNIIASITDLVEKFPILIKSLNNEAEYIIKYLDTKGLLFFDPSTIEARLIATVKENLNNLKSLAIGFSLSIAKTLLGLLNFFIGVFISLYILSSKDYFMRFIENILLFFTDKSGAREGVIFIRKVNNIFLKYVMGRLLTSVVVGIIVFVVMWLTKTPYALLSAVMIGIGNMIPYVGSIVAGFIATFLIILVAPIKIIYLYIAISIGQFVDGFVVGPKIISDSVGMSSFWTIIAVMISGNLFGPVGMFFGVPVFVVFKLIYQELLNKRIKKLESLEKRSKR